MLNAGEAILGVLRPVLPPSLQDRHRHTGKSPTEGCQDDEWTGAASYEIVFLLGDLQKQLGHGPGQQQLKLVASGHSPVATFISTEHFWCCFAPSVIGMQLECMQRQHTQA